jgi:hypothetical protein
MRLGVALFLITSVMAVDAFAQTQNISVDLAAIGAMTRSVDPGALQIRLDNRLPNARYEITVRREFIPITAISVGDIGSFIGLTPPSERSTACEPLSAAVDGLWSATSESDIPVRRGTVEALIAAAECKDQAILARAAIVRDRTRYDLAPITIRQSEKVTIAIKRNVGDGKSENWTVILETDAKGQWVTSYGFSFVPDQDELYNSVATDEEGKYKIVKENHEWGLKKPMPSVYFSWMGADDRFKTGTWSPTVGFGINESSPAIFTGVSYSFNHNLSFIFGAAVAPVRRLNGRYSVDQVISENLSQDQLLKTTYRPTLGLAVTLKFERNPFKQDQPATPVPDSAPAPSTPGNRSGSPAVPVTPAADPPAAATASLSPITEANRAPDIKLRFDSKGAVVDPATVATIVSRAKTATDVIIVSHGWWNDERTADCFYQKIIGGLEAAKPTYLSSDRFRPLYISVYWPSALFPMEPGDCVNERRTESTATDRFSVERVRQWASGAFPDAAARSTFENELGRVAALLERERTGNLTDSESTDLATLLVEWRNAAGNAAAAGDGGEPGAFQGTGKEIADRWRQRPEIRAEFSIPSLPNAKKWLNFGNAFTFWTMKERAGIVGSKGLGTVLRALQPARQANVKVHLIGHSFGGKLVTAGILGDGNGGAKVDTLVLLQAAFSQFAFASRAEILAARVTVDKDGAYRTVLSGNLVVGPIIATYSSADIPNRLLYPAGVAVVDDVTEAARAPRYGSLGANGMRGSSSASLDLALQQLDSLGATIPRAISVDGSRVIGGHSDLIKPQVFKLIWDAIGLAQ